MAASADRQLSRVEASGGATPLGWRFVLGVLYALIPAADLAEAGEIAMLAIQSGGEPGQQHLTVEIRCDRTILRLQSPTGAVCETDLALARAVTSALAEHDWRPAVPADGGGVLLSDAAAPAFWVLADVEGNEACLCTWQGRD